METKYKCLLVIVLCFGFGSVALCLLIGNTSLQEPSTVPLPIEATDNKRGKRNNKSDELFTCQLPAQPENGKWSVIPSNADPGEKISINSILKVECNSGYKLSQEIPYLICDLNWSSTKIPECEKLCPPMFNTSTTGLKCIDKNGKEISCREATEGTVLTYECAPFYEAPFGFRKTILCSDGSWSYPKPVCQPVCGRKVNDEAIPLIYGGKVQQGLEYPWIVALYKKNAEVYTNICGGSIISPKIVLTAAHCITNDYGELLPIEDYIVASGKFYNKYNDTRDKESQYRDISKIVVHSGYKGNSRRFLADIAIIVIERPFTLSYLVQPICFNEVNSVHLHAGNIGVVAGWGLRETGLPSEELRKLEIPYKRETVCAQELPRDWADKYNTIDKICAGFFNKNMSVCKGDSGNGLAFKNPEDNRYYIHGIVSVGPSNKGDCNIQQNSLYTKVAFYYEFIDKELNKYTTEDCKLPPYPKNGAWRLAEGDKAPGWLVSGTTPLKITCNTGFLRSSEKAVVQCQETLFDMPTCEKICLLPKFPPNTITACHSHRGGEIPCSKAIKNSLLSYTCPEGFGTSKGSKGVSKCLDGIWESPSPECRILSRDEEDTDIELPANTSKKILCTYASWNANVGVTPEDFDAKLCNVLVYAFVGLQANGTLREDMALDVGENGLYNRAVDMKKKNENLKVILSVGGQKGGPPPLFSSIASDPVKRSAFVESAKQFLDMYHFDGLDIEWHVPEKGDKENYVTLLRELKEKLKPHGYLLTATVRSHPEETGYDGQEMNKILDWVTVKSYDMYGHWSPHTGQNSALYPSSLDYQWEKQHLNVAAAANNWANLGISKNKMILSIAFYGRTFTLLDENRHGLHSATVGGGPGEGYLKYSEICKDYRNWTRQWDGEQKNPYKYSGNKWIGYDDKQSVLEKAKFIRDNDYLGVNVWPIDGDDVHGDCGPKQVLLKQVHKGLARN